MSVPRALATGSGHLQLTTRSILIDLLDRVATGTDTAAMVEKKKAALARRLRYFWLANGAYLMPAAWSFDAGSTTALEAPTFVSPLKPLLLTWAWSWTYVSQSPGACRSPEVISKNIF